jgi:GT2 family glycosyltransferase
MGYSYQVDVLIGIVVPTMGTRSEMLIQCLRSIRGAGSCLIAIVAPDRGGILEQVDASLFDLFVPDPNCGLAAAIDNGIRALPENILFVNWLVDDDLLIDNSLNKTCEVLKNDPDSVLVYGGCDYIDENGEFLWTNRSGTFAAFLLRFGPQLIPQPGALIRRDAYMAIGGLNTSFKWAFDLDLFIRLKRFGKLTFLNTTLAKFRWHEGSLSVGGRNGSVHEASEIRRNSLNPILRLFSPIWELPLRRIILNAGKIVTKRTTSTTKMI